MRRPSTHPARRGTVIPLTALLLTILVGMLAFSIDIGYVLTVQAELQNAADAGALAGAERMQNQYVQYYAPGANQSQVYNYVTTNSTDPKSPISTAQAYAGKNQAGGVYVQVPAADVSFSYYDGTNAPVPASYPNSFPNTINVTTRRDSTANGPLGLFFSQVFGWTQISLTATASATIYAGDVSSLQVIPGVNAHILPVALDVNVWKQFQSTGKSPGPTGYYDGSVVDGPNGLPQLQVYPTTTNTPGSFGLIDTGVPSSNTPAFRNWIDNGTTPNDINYLITNGLVPVSPTAPQQWTVGPGLKSTLLTNFQSQIGQANLIPLFAPVSTPPSYVAASGTGSTATYAVVGFAGVTISQANGSGASGLSVSIQPMAIVDPTAVLLNPQPARAGQTLNFGSGTTATTFVSAKLTQ